MLPIATFLSRNPFRYLPSLYWVLGLVLVALLATLYVVVTRRGDARRRGILNIAGPTVGLVLLYWLGAPVLLGDAVYKELLSYLSNGRALSSGLRLYAEEHDQRLPMAQSWAAATQAYLPNPSADPERVFGSPGGDSKYAFAFVEWWSGRRWPDESVASPPVLCEYLASELNAVARRPDMIAAERHGGPMVIVVTPDGSVKLQDTEVVVRAVASAGKLGR